MRLKHVVLALVMTLGGLPAQAQTPCRVAGALVSVPLPARPYAAVASNDGCKIFVSTQNTPGPGGATLLVFEGGKFSVKQSIKLDVQPAGLALSHDGKLLVAPGADGIAFIDTEKFAVLATLDDGGKGPIMARISADDKMLFVSDEMANGITVIDLAKARATGFKADSILAKISTGRQPVGLALSPDERFLYASVEIANTGPTVCKDAARAGAAETPAYAEGTLTIIDVAKTIVAELPSGCRPIRVVLSKDGGRAFVSARGSNQIIGFDTAKARAGDKTAKLGTVTLPASAFGIAMSPSGSLLFASTGATLTLIDPAKIAQGQGAISGSIDTAGSARDLNLMPDGTLLLTNGTASSVDIVSVNR